MAEKIQRARTADRREEKYKFEVYILSTIPSRNLNFKIASLYKSCSDLNCFCRWKFNFGLWLTHIYQRSGYHAMIWTWSYILQATVSSNSDVDIIANQGCEFSQLDLKSVWRACSKLDSVQWNLWNSSVCMSLWIRKSFDNLISCKFNQEVPFQAEPRETEKDIGTLIEQ